MTASTITRPTYCPEWCVVPAEQHEAEREGWEGACVHWSAEIGLYDGESVKVGMTTAEDGTDLDATAIFVGVDPMSLTEAKATAEALIVAAAIVVGMTADAVEIEP
jgi:hypothetical protein